MPAAVAGKYLYIDGGEISYRTGDSIVYQYGKSSTTLSLDLSQDWANSSVVFNVINKPPEAPSLSDSSLWYDEDDDIFYSGFTGRSSIFEGQPDPPPISVWSFKPDGTGSGSWKIEISPDDPKWTRRTRTDLGYTASGGGSALVLGGVLNPWTIPESMDLTQDIIVPGLIEFNFTKKGFFNSSATGFNANGVGKSGAMHYVPSFGPNGLFMILGGTDFSDPDQNIGMENIWIYETLENRWYNQTATGSIPAGRRNFCLAGVESTNGTYEIFLYGGFDGRLGSSAIPYDEIYILTLPAFHWLKVDYPPEHPRHGHSCNAVGGSQIVSIGGIDSNAQITVGALEDVRKSSFNSSVDPLTQGLGIFDMTLLEWVDLYRADAGVYEQSELIKSYYRDNPQNNASRFSSSALEDLFSVTHFSQQAAPPPSSPLTPPSSSNHPLSTAAIAGIVIGAFIALTLLLTISFLLFRRRRRTPHRSQHPNRHDRRNAAELRGSDGQMQEADSDAVVKTPVIRGWQRGGLAELEEVTAEMGGDEVVIVEMGAREREREREGRGMREVRGW
ncbi:MAG: hypothetical protein Q9169_007085 [Polycauliona sp. 2 TL-2023]